MIRAIRFGWLLRRDRRLLLEAGLMVAAVRLGLWLLPFQTLRAWLARSTPAALSEGDPEVVGKVAWAVRRTSRLVPGATCLTQALAAQVLLHRRGLSATLHIGVMKDDRAKLAAHAWVISHGRVVVGGKGLACYTPLVTMGPWGEDCGG